MTPEATRRNHAQRAVNRNDFICKPGERDPHYPGHFTVRHSACGIQRATLGSWAIAIQKRSIASIIVSITLLLSGFVMYPLAWLS